MDRRHAILTGLSLDHQTMLQYGTHLEQAAKHPVHSQLQAARPFLAHWLQVFLDHLEEEERVLLPRFADDTMAGKIRICNKELREQVDWLRFAVLDPGGPGPVLRAVGDSLRQHVRMCEWELFDGIQDQFDDDGLAALGGELEYLRQVREARAKGQPAPPKPGTPDLAPTRQGGHGNGAGASLQANGAAAGSAPRAAALPKQGPALQAPGPGLHRPPASGRPPRAGF